MIVVVTDLRRIAQRWIVRIEYCLSTVALALGLSVTGNITFAESYITGLQAYHRGDHQLALEILLPLAQEGDAKAQNNVGIIYANAEEGLEDDEEAVRWYRLAAAQGNTAAHFNLGFMYANGSGVPEDDSEAVRLSFRFHHSRIYE